MVTINLPFSADTLQAWAIALALVVASAFASWIAGKLRRKNGQPDALMKTKRNFGMPDLPDWLFLAGILMWSVLAFLLFTGLVGLILSVIVEAITKSADLTQARVSVLQLAGLTATLGAVVALPFTILRLKVGREQAETQAAALFNDKINAASEDLHAMRQRTLHDKSGAYGKTIWEADVTRRNAAIDRLEGLVSERPSEASRAARLLCVYVRELSREYPPRNPGEGMTGAGLVRWAKSLRPERTDLQTAVTSLGRLCFSYHLSSEDMNLEGANLQGLHLPGITLRNANLSGAHLQGASLQMADLRGTDLSKALLIGSDLHSAKLQEAEVVEANLTGARLNSAEVAKSNFRGVILQLATLWFVDFRGVSTRNALLEGADICACKFSGKRSLRNARLKGARLAESDLTDSKASATQLEMTFVDTNVIAPDEFDVAIIDQSMPAFSDNSPSFWVRSPELRDKQWREWQKSIGFDPEDPATWD